ncbi:putative E3 ubiquitin-protein ligase makorin-1 isoform X2 [Mixophyes fleayi]|uniref:putative E3 ubiquitin-protein ligase makorin-1 isoform X2 n=1 Tax=Mixophyes fleayi TaxID=3061075 RepID=UPI003F4DDD87
MAMASSRGHGTRAPCRAFLRGNCRWGTNCKFSHEKICAPICRHYQNGFCCYGDRCSYLHLPPSCWLPDAPPHYLAARRVSEPCVVPHVSGPQASRRGSEPSVTPLRVAGAEIQRLPVQARREDWALAAEFIPRNAGLVRSVSSPILTGDSKTEQAECQDGTKHRTSMEIIHSKKFERSRDVVCGICMDKVYDKQLAEERIFGILPNCSHAYCVGCIKRWRKTRDFENEVIKGCPQCRVKSSFFIPHKYWIGETAEKLELIENFKARTGKIRCRFFLRGNGHCPFKSECIYLHDLPHGHRRRRREQRRSSASSLSYSHLVGIYEENFSEAEDIDLMHCALTLTLIEDHFEMGLGFPEEVEALLGQYSDSE